MNTTSSSNIDDLLTDIARWLERSCNVNIIIVDDTLDTYRF